MHKTHILIKRGVKSGQSGQKWAENAVFPEFLMIFNPIFNFLLDRSIKRKSPCKSSVFFADYLVKCLTCKDACFFMILPLSMSSWVTLASTPVSIPKRYDDFILSFE